MSDPTTDGPGCVDLAATAGADDPAGGGGGPVDGDALAGYDALVRGAAAYVDRSRRVFRVAGDRAPEMLQGLLTADIRQPGKGAAWPTLILTPKGRVLADAVVVRVGDDLLLDVPDASWVGLEPHLERYLPPRFAKLEPASLELLRVRGPEAAARCVERLPELAGLAAARREKEEGTRWAAAAVAGGYAVRPGDPWGDGIDLYRPTDGTSPRAKSGDGEAGTVDEDEERLPRISTEAWEAWRVEKGIPLYGRDVSEDNLPQETGLVAATTSFSKGCYTGQEVLARIHYRGKVNRYLRGLRVSGPSEPSGPSGGTEPPLAVGDELSKGSRAVGSVTSVVRSPRHGWIGLGCVRREVAPGEEIGVGKEGSDGARVVVVELPFE